MYIYIYLSAISVNSEHLPINRIDSGRRVDASAYFLRAERKDIPIRSTRKYNSALNMRLALNSWTKNTEHGTKLNIRVTDWPKGSGSRHEDR